MIGLPLAQYSVEIIPVKCLFHNLLNYHQGIRIELMAPLFFEGMEDFHIGKVLEVVGLLLKWNSVSEGSLRYQVPLPSAIDLGRYWLIL